MRNQSKGLTGQTPRALGRVEKKVTGSAGTERDCPHLVLIHCTCRITGEWNFCSVPVKSRPTSVHKQVREREEAEQEETEKSFMRNPGKTRDPGREVGSGRGLSKCRRRFPGAHHVPHAALQVTSLTSPPGHFSLTSPVCCKPSVWGQHYVCFDSSSCIHL